MICRRSFEIAGTTPIPTHQADATCATTQEYLVFLASFDAKAEWWNWIERRSCRASRPPPARYTASLASIYRRVVTCSTAPSSNTHLIVTDNTLYGCLLCCGLQKWDVCHSIRRALAPSVKYVRFRSTSGPTSAERTKTWNVFLVSCLLQQRLQCEFAQFHRRLRTISCSERHYNAQFTCSELSERFRFNTRRRARRDERKGHFYHRRDQISPSYSLKVAREKR